MLTACKSSTNEKQIFDVEPKFHFNFHNFEFAKTLSATFEKFETTKSPKKHHQLKLLCCLFVIPDKTQEDKAKKVLIKIMNYNQLKME